MSYYNVKIPVKVRGINEEGEEYKEVVEGELVIRVYARNADAAAKQVADAIETRTVGPCDYEGCDIKDHTLAHLDLYLEAYEKRVIEQGGHVHYAPTAAEAQEIINEQGGFVF